MKFTLTFCGTQMPVASLLVLLASTLVQAAPDVAELHAILRSDAMVHDKAVACKQLAVVGTAESVPILAELLSDDKLSHYARFGLEAIPDKSVDRALRNALPKLGGDQQLGVIQSIGARRDAEAVPALDELLNGTDVQVASAAARALGQIGDQRAVRILLKKLGESHHAARLAIADAVLASAQQRVADGRADRAVEIFDHIRGAELPKHIIVAATHSAVRHRGKAGGSLLRELLRSSDDDLFEVALQASRELPASVSSSALIAELGQAAPPKKALIVAALADTGDHDALSVLVATLDTGDLSAQLAAIRGLAQIGDGTVVRPLLKLSGSASSAVATAAQSALAHLPGPNVDESIIGAVEDSSAEQLPILLKLIGNRRIEAGVPVLLEAVRSDQDLLRWTAIEALGKTAESSHLNVLVNAVRSAASSDDAAVAKASLTAACMRMTDREGTVEKLIPFFDRAPAESQLFLFELLREVGGESALRHVASKATVAEDKIQDAATRVLGEWLTVDVAPELLRLTRSLDSNKYKIRSLRGYIRIIRQFGLPVDERVTMARQALEVAERDDERRLVLQALARFPDVESLKVAVEQVNRPSLKRVAAQTAVGIAEKIVDRDPESVRRAMELVIEARLTPALTDRARAVQAKLE